MRKEKNDWYDQMVRKLQINGKVERFFRIVRDQFKRPLNLLFSGRETVMELREVYTNFNLSGDPFSKEIKTDALQMLPGVKAALEQLRILFATRGIGILTGESGSGKTCLLRLAVRDLPKGIYQSHYVCHTSVGILEFYTHLYDAFGLQPCGRRAIMFKRIHDHILHMNKANHVHPVLIIDEADKPGNDILQEIRLIANFEYDSLNAVTTLLCGQTHLIQKLGLSILVSLANSITITVRISNLKKEETFAYLEQRMGLVSTGGVIFTKPVMTFHIKPVSCPLHTFSHVFSVFGTDILGTRNGRDKSRSIFLSLS